MRAESLSSSGRVRKNWRMKKEQDHVVPEAEPQGHEDMEGMAHSPEVSHGTCGTRKRPAPT